MGELTITAAVLGESSASSAAKSIWKASVSAGQTFMAAPAVRMNTPYSGKRGAKVITSSPGWHRAHRQQHSPAAAPQVR